MKSLRPVSSALLFTLMIACEAPPREAEVQTQNVASALPPPTPTPELAAAMAKLSFMRGVWVGPATGFNPDGSKYTVTQTERMGPMLGGDIIVIEGRGYRDDDTTGFNAFAVVSWNPRAKRYEMRSYAQGNAGTFELKLTADGYTWEIPAGPDTTIRFTATVEDGHWREIGEVLSTDKPPMQTFEMELVRIAATDWPLGTPVPPQ